MKKHTVLYLCLGAFLLTLTAFGTNYIITKKNSPKEVALLFLNAVDEKRYEEAKQYGTSVTAEFLNTMIMLDTEPYNPALKKKYTVPYETITENTAVVTYITNGDYNAQSTLKLEKDAKLGWLVVYSKDGN